MAHDEGYEQLLEIKATARAIAKWLRDNPGATAGDMAGEQLLELCKELADKCENA